MSRYLYQEYLSQENKFRQNVLECSAGDVAPINQFPLVQCTIRRTRALMQLNLEDISLKIKLLLKDKEYFNLFIKKIAMQCQKETLYTYFLYHTSIV